MRDKKPLSFEKDLLRLPGQSATEQFNELIDSQVSFYFFAAASGIVLIAVSWLSYFIETLNPYVITFATIPLVGYCVYKFVRVYPQLDRLKQGIKGERYTGQVLEELRANGYRVFHDVIGDNFNIDHVLIGPSGIYIVETKTWRNNPSIKSVDYDGKQLRLNGYAVPKNPILQAQSAALWLKNILQQSTGERFFVTPIIALPSKFIETEVTRKLQKDGINLLNPKNIHFFLKNKKTVLSKEKINQTTLHLSRIITARIERN